MLNEEQENNPAKAYPAAMHDLLWAILAEDASLWPYKVEDVLGWPSDLPETRGDPRSRFVDKVGRKLLFVSNHGLDRQQNVYHSDERR
jgi:hypothetical protein